MESELPEPQYTNEVSAYIQGLSERINYIADKIKEYGSGDKIGLDLEGIYYENQEEFAIANGAAGLNANWIYGGAKFLEEAVQRANKEAKTGEIVLLSPASASFDAFKNFMERGEKFKQFVNELK